MRMSDTPKRKAPEGKAEDSPRVQKARRKLLKKIEKDNQKTTPEALANAASIIKNQFNRHLSERVPLKDKFSMFDEGEHSAPSGRAVKNTRDKIKNMFTLPSSPTADATTTNSSSEAPQTTEHTDHTEPMDTSE